MSDPAYARLTIGGVVNGVWFAEWLRTHFRFGLEMHLADYKAATTSEILAWVRENPENDDGRPFIADQPRPELIISDCEANYGSWPDAEQDLINAKIPFDRSNEAGGDYGATWGFYRPEQGQHFIEHDTLDSEWAIQIATVRRFLKHPDGEAKLTRYLNKHYPDPLPLPAFVIVDTAHARAAYLAEKAKKKS